MGRQPTDQGVFTRRISRKGTIKRSGNIDMLRVKRVRAIPCDRLAPSSHHLKSNDQTQWICGNVHFARQRSFGLFKGPKFCFGQYFCLSPAASRVASTTVAS